MLLALAGSRYEPFKVTNVAWLRNYTAVVYASFKQAIVCTKPQSPDVCL